MKAGTLRNNREIFPCTSTDHFGSLWKLSKKIVHNRNYNPSIYFSTLDMHLNTH